MRARIVIALDGSMAVFVDEGTVEQAEALAAKLYAAIGQAVPVTNLSAPEQHRHDHEHAHHHVVSTTG